VKSPKRRYNIRHKRRPEFAPRDRPKPLAYNEVEAAFRNNARFPPLLSLNRAAQLAHFAPSNIKRLVSEGYFCNSVRRGKPLAFWRDRFVVEIMESDRARKHNKQIRPERR
jgi:hypothetical protein